MSRTGTFESQYSSDTSSFNDAAVRSVTPMKAKSTAMKADASLGLSIDVIWGLIGGQKLEQGGVSVDKELTRFMASPMM